MNSSSCFISHPRVGTLLRWIKCLNQLGGCSLASLLCPTFQFGFSAPDCYHLCLQLSLLFLVGGDGGRGEGSECWGVNPGSHTFDMPLSQALELSIYPNQIQCVHIDQYSHSVVYCDFAIRFLYSPLNVFPSLSAFSIFFLQMTICIGSLKISFP